LSANEKKNRSGGASCVFPRVATAATRSSVAAGNPIRILGDVG
jgi:hypothetical protein